MKVVAKSSVRDYAGRVHEACRGAENMMLEATVEGLGYA